MPTWQAPNLIKQNIVIGLPRTGTTSLCAELSMPGHKFEVEPVLENFINPPHHTTKYLTTVLWDHQELNKQLQTTVIDGDYNLHWTWRLDMREWLLSGLCCRKLDVWGYPSPKSNAKLKPFLAEDTDLEYWIQRLHQHNLLLAEWHSLYPQVFFKHYPLEHMQYASGKQMPIHLKEQLVLNLRDVEEWYEYVFVKSEAYEQYLDDLERFIS